MPTLAGLDRSASRPQHWLNVSPIALWRRTRPTVSELDRDAYAVLMPVGGALGRRGQPGALRDRATRDSRSRLDEEPCLFLTRCRPQLVDLTELAALRVWAEVSFPASSVRSEARRFRLAALLANQDTSD